MVLSSETGRYEYPCQYKEDTRLSPYVAKWLLGRCSTASLTN